MEERVAIFIDGGNLYHCLKKDFLRTKLNFEKFTRKIVGDRRLFRVYYYAALPKQKDDPEKYVAQQRFLDALDHVPYFDVHIGKLIVHDGVKKELGLDVQLAVDMLEMAYTDAYDTAILVSGDGDMASAVSAVKRLGKHVENVTTPSTSSDHLRKICDRVLILDNDFLNDCWEEVGEKPSP
ncbi:MAG: NYN domain-containing protein [Anaerolineales bacterium]|nr:NYN domain-containing protein [Anaerolineales bacterium]NUQ86446.1 NYN domain-containing protein [Anaerolineales bacterium]